MFVYILRSSALNLHAQRLSVNKSTASFMNSKKSIGSDNTPCTPLIMFVVSVMVLMTQLFVGLLLIYHLEALSFLSTLLRS